MEAVKGFTRKWKHTHTKSCRWEPELGWACHYSPEEKEIWRLEKLLYESIRKD